MIVEASSGNIGISIAAIAARKGLKCLIVVPESISEKRLNMLDFFRC
ncbi:pyridoxal-phosphate dependent enzyme [Candidatus Hodgkinia cicadicola]